MEAKNKGPKTCKVEGCDVRAHCRGWCASHYSRWYRTGDPLGVMSNNNPVPEGYLTTAQAADFLGVTTSAIHQALARGTLQGDTWLNTKVITQVSLDEYKASEKRLARTAVCKWEGCDNSPRAHGLCLKHYQKARYSAECEEMIPEKHRAPRCFIAECDNPQYAKGLCRKHDAVDKYHGEGSLPLMVEGEVEPQSVGGRIKMHRIRQGLTLRQLAERVGVTHQRVNSVEQQSKSMPSTVYKFAQALGVSADKLIPGLNDEIEPRHSASEGSWHQTPCPYCKGFGHVEMRPLQQSVVPSPNGNGNKSSDELLLEEVS